jgi:guanylate kinase
VKSRFPDSLCVFIVPPSLEALEERLRARMTESEDEIQSRLKIAATELAELDYYDYAIENEVAAQCAQRLSDIVDEWQQKYDSNLRPASMLRQREREMQRESELRLARAKVDGLLGTK